LILAYQDHEPIFINRTEDFITYGFPGNGSQQFPYLIESLNISTDGYCINIMNVNDCFIIRGCLLSSSSADIGVGINISNVINGTIEYCIISHKEMGVSLNSSVGCLVTHCVIEDNSQLGVMVNKSLNCTLNNITMYNNGEYGVIINDSLKCDISNCTIRNHIEMGIEINFSSECKVFESISIFNKRGLNTLLTNQCIFEKNILESNSWDGVYLHTSNNCILFNNTIYSNSGFGIVINQGHNNLLYGNRIGWNTNNGLDNGLNNMWDDGVSQGNFWSDCVEGVFYEIPGAGRGIDYYPFSILSINHPTDIQLEAGSSEYYLIWTVSALFPHSYTLYMNDSLIRLQPWNGSDIIIPINSAELMVINYTIVLYDVNGHFVQDTIIVRIIDTTLPILDHPVDIEYEVGIIGNEITWNPIDNNPRQYKILRNGKIIRAGGWYGLAITISVDNLEAGLYNYTLIVYDAGGYMVYDTVFVNVKPANGNANQPSTNTQADSFLYSPVLAGALFFAGALIFLQAVALQLFNNRTGLLKLKHIANETETPFASQVKLGPKDEDS
jgi:parallel beta-helix repeat protein